MNENQTTGPLEESPGVKSSKRIAGAVLVAAGSLLLVAAGTVALFNPEPMPNASVAIAAGSWLVGAGVSVLVGGTAAESLAKLGGRA
ncbi:MAG: hypothetical protein JNG85_00250 [Spirochaetaceae bacterium]|nr:hypothetical protein [Spirochaetaceae bacterium]